MQPVSMAIGVQRQTEMHPITTLFAGINDHLHSRGFLSRLREPTTAESAGWPAIKDILETMSEVVDTLLVLDEVLGLELSNFSRQLKLKPGIDDDYQVIVAMSNDLWFRG